jgi:hypothetical protein
MGCQSPRLPRHYLPQAGGNLNLSADVLQVIQPGYELLSPEDRVHAEANPIGYSRSRWLPWSGLTRRAHPAAREARRQVHVPARTGRLLCRGPWADPVEFPGESFARHLSAIRHLGT